MLWDAGARMFVMLSWRFMVARDADGSDRRVERSARHRSHHTAPPDASHTIQVLMQTPWCDWAGMGRNAKGSSEPETMTMTAQRHRRLGFGEST